MNKKSTGKRYVIAIPETLHYRLKETALRKKSNLTKLVEQLLWEALKVR